MNIKEYIASGILEEFVLGQLTEENQADVMRYAEKYPEVKDELVLIEKGLEALAQNIAVAPPVHLKSEILDAIKSSESTPEVPLLSIHSKIADFQFWLDSVDAPDEFDNMHMEILRESPESTMVIAWIKEGEQNHLHETYTEKFLIVEGTCEAVIDGKLATYGVGEYVEFPIDTIHSYKVTSEIPMKVIACLEHKVAS